MYAWLQPMVYFSYTGWSWSKRHMKTPKTATCGDMVTLTGDACMVIADNFIMSSAWKECNKLYTVLTKLQWSHFDEKYTVYFFFGPAKFHTQWQDDYWLCALTRECRGSFVTSQRLLHGHCCPPQMTLAAGGTSMSSAALYGQSVGCNSAWSDTYHTRPCARYSWTVAAASQEYWNVRCLLRRYVHTNVNRRRLLRYYDQLRRWMRCSFLRDCGTGLPVCTLRVLVCSGSHRGCQHWQQIWDIGPRSQAVRDYSAWAVNGEAVVWSHVWILILTPPTRKGLGTKLGWELVWVKVY